GGLFMPEHIPTVDMEVVMQKANISFAEMALYLSSLFFGDSLSENTLRKVSYGAFDFQIKLSNTGALELFHGPTMAFKDFGARFMGRILNQIKTRDMVILTATSGDTGSAVASGFYGMDGIKVVVLYPKGRVSDFQERQMTTLGSNIKALRVDGSFDDCQAMVKEIFADSQYCSMNGITSANSISILRWIPQSFYYFYGYYLWKNQGGQVSPVIAVPSGNFGNITAGLMAHKMGLPVKQFIAATNANDTIPQLMEKGYYTPKASVTTLSNAMDVGAPSNYERLMDLYNGDIEAIRKILTAVSYTDEQTIESIRELQATQNYISDPHSAIGQRALKEYGQDGFYIATAHPCKFASVIKQALSLEAPHPATMERYFQHHKEYTNIIPTSGALKEFLRDNL
ncbi:MAG: threonine synthase, partial [Mucinivorans sp.]